MALSESDLPEKLEGKSWSRDRALESRIEKLKRARDLVARELQIDPSLLAPKHLLTSIAALAPESAEQLSEIERMRSWQRRVVGEQLIRALGRG